jgi:hypothetical protein
MTGRNDGDQSNEKRGPGELLTPGPSADCRRTTLDREDESDGSPEAYAKQGGIIGGGGSAGGAGATGTAPGEDAQLPGKVASVSRTSIMARACSSSIACGGGSIESSVIVRNICELTTISSAAI